MEMVNQEVGDEVCLHRYNRLLPESYREELVQETREKRAALRALAQWICGEQIQSDDAEEMSDGGEGMCEGAEGYERETERDIAAFEKGLSIYLDLKYHLVASDYDVFARTLIRAVLMPGIDLGLRAKTARTLVRLLRKRECKISFAMPWRAIRDIIVDIHIDSAEGSPYVGKDVRDAHCREVTLLFRKSRNYLGPQAENVAREIWEELGPKINIARSDEAFEPLLLLSYILPTRGKAWSGWVPRAMELWQSIESSTDWDNTWLTLVSRMAKDQPNVIDMSPYLNLIYQRISLSFRLPLGAAAPQSPVERRCPAHCVFLLTSKYIAVPAAAFCIYSLSPRKPETLEHLKRLIALVTNFYHPSNHGKWSNFLASFLGHSTANLAKRVSNERAATRAGILERVIGDNQVKAVPPVEDRLSDDLADEIVRLFMPLVELGLHAKIGYMTVQAAASARDLAVVSPGIVVNPLLNLAVEGLHSVATPHRTSAALRMLATLTPVFLDPDFCPDGAASLPQALQLTLPGIDANDPSKTEATFRFIAGASARIQRHLAAEEGGELAFFLEEYAHELLDRIFALLESLEAPPKKIKSGTVPTAAPSLSSFIFSIAMDNFFAAVPLSVAESVAERISRQISSAAITNALKFYGALVRTAAAACSLSERRPSAAIFLPILIGQVLEDKGDDTILASLSEEEMVWRLRMLAQACRTCSGLLEYSERVFTACLLAMRHPSRKVYKAGGRLLRGLLEGLTSVKILFGSGLLDTWSDDGPPFSWSLCTAADFTAAELYVSRALDLAEEFAFHEHGRSQPYELAGVKVDREGLFHAVRILHAAQRGGRWIMSGALSTRFEALSKFRQNKDLGKMTKQEAKLMLRRPIAAGLGGEKHFGDPERATRLWNRAYSMILSILEAVALARPDDGALLYRCLEPIELAHESFKSKGRISSQAERGYKVAYKPVMAMKQSFGSNYGVGRLMPRFVQKLRIETLHEARLTLSAIGGLASRDLHEKLTTKVSELALNDFPRVRSQARSSLVRALRVELPRFRRGLIERTIAELGASADIVPSKGTPDYEKMMGAADVLRSSASSPYIMRDWRLLELGGRAMLKAVVAAERPDAASLVHALFAKLSSLSRPLGIAPLVLTSPDLVPFEGCSTDEAMARSPGLDTYRRYTEFLVGQLTAEDATGGGSPSSADAHWRLQSFVATSLYLSIRSDITPSEGIVFFFVNNMISDLVILRQICAKAIALILTLVDRGEMELDKKKMQVIFNVLKSDDFPPRLLRTLALDQVDDNSESGGSPAIGYGGGLDSLAGRSLLNIAKNIDGDACWVLASGRPWPAGWTPRSRDNLALTRVRLFEILFRAFGAPLLDAFRDSIDALIQDTDSIAGVTKASCRTIVAEAVAGVGRGLKMTSVDQAGYSLVMRWTNALLEVPSGHEGMVNSGTFIRLLISGSEDSLGSHIGKNLLLALLKTPLFEPDTGAQVQTRKLRYIHSCIADLDVDHESGIRAVEILVPVLTSTNVFSHYLKSVREEIARLLCVLGSFRADEAVMAFGEGVETVSSRLGSREVVELEGESSDERSEDDRKAVSREGETLSRWVSVVHWNGDARAFHQHTPKILPALFLALDDKDPERVSHARLALSLAAQSRLSPDTLESVVRVCETAAKSPRWRIRGSTLSFLQVLGFSCSFSGGETILRKIRSIIIDLLSDEQLEVREAAAHTMVPLIRDAPDEAISSVRELLLQRLHETQPSKRGRASLKLSPEEVQKRHSAVLGLSSMVMSAPYVVPKWMPSVLLALSRCVDDHPPISPSARRIFAEFWRTHRDEWPTHKLAFAEDELEIVSDLLISPSYYA